eukprot:COSAG02_NODE_9755_length_2119_cov_235.483663_1_plen_30_part_10
MSNVVHVFGLGVQPSRCPELCLDVSLASSA